LTLFARNDIVVSEMGGTTMKLQDKDILDDVRRVRDMLGRIPAGDDYKEHGRFGFNTVRRRFGNQWNKCLLKLFGEVAHTRQNERVKSECEFCHKPITFLRSSPKRFCSPSCSNKGVKRRKRKIWICSECGKEAKYQRVKCPDCIAGAGTASKTLGEYKNRKNDANRYSDIRGHARIIAKALPDKCFSCGYDKSVVVCHKIPITEFPDDTLVGVVNALSNLVKLCRNHHWELDNGLLKLSGV
jgi:ribosomal protein L37AE/L43A